MFRRIYLIYAVLKFCNGHLLSRNESAKKIAIELANLPLSTSLELQSNILAAAVTEFGHVEPLTPISHVDSVNFMTDLINGAKNADVKLNFKQLVIKYGYRFEHHEVFTEDGYVLSVFRIPGNGTTVFLMHGLLGSADDFIVAGPASGLAYLLAEKGYDVWVGNARGNKHSRQHVSLDPAEPSFWDFSWHEVGVSDLPAMIDYVLDSTKKTSLKYIGYSQGTTVFFVMASVKPDYNKKVSFMIALSPVVFMGRSQSPIIRLLSPRTLLMQELTKGIGSYEFLPDNDLKRTLKQLVCGAGSFVDIVCRNVMFLMSGVNFNQLNVSNLPMVFAHLPAGASTKQLTHYGQGLISEHFRLFDYGSMENYEKYGTMEPPSYRLGVIDTAISMFYSDSDWLADPQDVARLSYKLKNVVDLYKIPYKSFSHVDFIIAKDVKKIVYARLFQLLSVF